eukprot:1968771-Amphidinium_carterae.2
MEAGTASLIVQTGLNLLLVTTATGQNLPNCSCTSRPTKPSSCVAADSRWEAHSSPPLTLCLIVLSEQLKGRHQTWRILWCESWLTLHGQPASLSIHNSLVPHMLNLILSAPINAWRALSSGLVHGMDSVADYFMGARNPAAIRICLFTSCQQKACDQSLVLLPTNDPPHMHPRRSQVLQAGQDLVVGHGDRLAKV